MSGSSPLPSGWLQTPVGCYWAEPGAFVAANWCLQDFSWTDGAFAPHENGCEHQFAATGGGGARIPSACARSEGLAALSQSLEKETWPSPADGVSGALSGGRYDRVTVPLAGRLDPGDEIHVRLDRG